MCSRSGGASCELLYSGCSVAEWLAYWTKAERLVRGWQRADRSQIRYLITASRLCQPVLDDADIEELFASHDAVLRDIADKLAPVHTVRRRPGRPTPLFDDECRAERRNCRRLERLRYDTIRDAILTCARKPT